MIVTHLANMKVSWQSLFIVTKESGPFPPLPVVTTLECFFKSRILVALINEPCHLGSVLKSRLGVMPCLWRHFKDNYCRERIRRSPLPHAPDLQHLYITGKALLLAQSKIHT